MHPVLGQQVEPIARAVEGLTLEEAQIHPLPGQGRWSAQEIVEHLILTYELTKSVVSRQVAKGKPPRNRRSILEGILRLQGIGLGIVPTGVPAILALKPTRYRPMGGKDLAARLLQSAEEMDAVLVEARRKFGITACGEHPFYGVLRVDEWRRYHVVHGRHHLRQLTRAIEYARQPAGPAAGVPKKTR